MLKLKDGVVLPAVTKAAPAEPKVTFIQKTIKGDTFLVMAQTSIELEDEYTTLYYTAHNQNNLFLEPPFDPTVLLNLVNTNNTLNQCIEVMEVNVDGTGYDFVQLDDEGDKPDPDELEEAKAFFGEPYPNESFQKIRRKLRRQLESVGYAYLEILRNQLNEIVGFRNVETHHVRMVKLDEPVMVEKKLLRGAKEVTMKMWDRERRYAQRVALKTLVYYKEFGATRDVDRNTGRWETKDNPLLPQNKGTELMIFGINPDVMTPYFLPRWINQLPSVIGSRKAEEQNLQFLDAGGMPPAIIFIQGGTLGKQAADQLNMYLSGQNKNKFRAAVVEAVSSSGSMDSAGTVKVSVERFGAEQAKDAMFMKYDENTYEHVRVGFRIPPLFLGKAADYNFATAQTAYMVTEAQVFQKEREQFDSLINMTIMKELGFKTIKLKSKPITLRDVANQLEALKIVKDVATRDSFLETINDMTGLELELAPEPQPDPGAATDPLTGGPAAPGAPGSVMSSGRVMPGQPQPPPLPQQPATPPMRGGVQKPQFTAPTPKGAITPGAVLPKAKPAGAPNGATPGTPAKFKKVASELIALADDFAAARGLIPGRQLSPARQVMVKQEVDELDEDDMNAFNMLVAKYAYGKVTPDLELIAALTVKGEA